MQVFLWESGGRKPETLIILGSCGIIILLSVIYARKIPMIKGWIQDEKEI